MNRKPPRSSSSQGGFTLPEAMAIVAAIGVVASMAGVSFHRMWARQDADKLAQVIHGAAHQARQRALTTRAPYVLDVRAGSVRYCRVDPATITAGPPSTTTQTRCPPPDTTLETSGLFLAGADASVSFWSDSVEVRQAGGAVCGTAARVAIGSGVPIYFGPSGTVDETFANVMSSGLPLGGVTLFVRRTSVDDLDKRRRVVIYGPSAKPRIVYGY